MLELYHSPMSVCSQKVRLVLAEKNLSWVDHILNLRGGNGVPTLVHEGKAIRESTLINEYIEDSWPEPPLRPGNSYQRYAIRLWTKVPDDGLHTACADITYVSSIRDTLRNSTPDQLKAQLSGSPDLQKRDRRRQAIEMGVEAPSVGYALSLYDQTLDEMEQALGQNIWLEGTYYSLADAALTPYVVRLQMLGMEEMWALRPNVARWLQQVQLRDNYAKAINKFATDQQLRTWHASGQAVWPALKERLAALKVGQARTGEAAR